MLSMRRRDRGAAIGIAVALWVGLFALGSAPRWAACLTAALALACAAPFLISRRSVPWTSPLLLLLGLAAAFTAAQLLPLPAGLVAWLSPDRHTLAMDNADALGMAPPSFLFLSYDPPATLLELAKLAGYLAFAFACTRLTVTANGRTWIATITAAAGTLMAVIGLAHHALGVKALFGLYEPRSKASAYLAPLLNENHFAGFLALATPLALALAVTSAGARRLLWVGAAAACAATNLLLASRVGAVALIAGVLVVIVLLLTQRHRERDLRLSLSVLVPAGIVAACAVIVLVTLTAGEVRSELARTSAAELQDPASKLGIWRATADLLDDNRWTGVGRGAFEPAFTRLHHGGIKTYSHVENEYLQAAVDWGVPAAAALLLALGWTLLQALRRHAAGPIEAGALAAVVAIALHNGADFSLEMSGVALAAIATLAILVPAQSHTVGSARRQRQLALRMAAMIAGAALIGLAASPVGRTARDSEQRLAVLVQDQAAVDRAIEQGRNLIERHPSDYLLMGLTAQAYFQKRDPRAVRLINRALALNPRHPGLHVLAAHMLVGAGRRSQALIEYALALDYTFTPREVLADLLRWFPNPDEAALGIPARPDRIAIMTNRLVTLKRSDVALAYAKRVYAQYPEDFETQSTIAALALERGEIALAIRAGRAAYQHSRHAADALVLARALRAANVLDEPVAVLEEAIRIRRYDKARQLVQLYAALAEAQSARGDHLAARVSLRTAIELAGSRVDRRTRAGLQRKLSQIEELLGNPGAAAEARSRASNLEPP